VTNAARALIAVAILAVVVALVVAFAGVLVYRATLRGSETRLQPIGVPTAVRARG
jgi:hypothetical protein